MTIQVVDSLLSLSKATGKGGDGNVDNTTSFEVSVPRIQKSAR